MKRALLPCALTLVCLLQAWGDEQAEPADSAADREAAPGPSIDETAEQWIGKTSEELLAKWGPPSRTKQLRGGEELLVYKIVVSGDARPTNDTRIPLSSPVPAGSPTTDSGDRHDGGNFEDGRFWIDTKGSVEAPVKDKLKAKFRIDAQGTIAEVEISPSKSKKGQEAR